MNIPGQIEWVSKDAFVMPVLPSELGVDPLFAALLYATAFLVLSGDESVDPDWGLEALEHMGYYLQRLPPSEVERFRLQLGRIADYGERQSWPKEFTSFVRGFLRSFGFEEDE